MTTTYNIDIKLIPFETCLIHKATHADLLQNFRKIFII